MLCDNFLWQGEGEGASDSAVESLAHDIYNSAPVPNAKDEEWTFTHLDRFITDKMSPSPILSLPSIDKQDAQNTTSEHAKLTFVNGYFSEDLSVVKAPLIISEETGISETETYKKFFEKFPISAMSMQCSHKKWHLQIPEGSQIHMQIVFIGSNQDDMTHPQMTHHGHFLRLSIGAGAQVELFEKHISAEQNACYIHHDFLRIELAMRAKLHHYKLQLNEKSATHLGHADVHLQGKSHYDYRLLHLGGNLARQDIHVHLMQPEAAADVQALLLPVAGQVNHLSTDLRHISKDCLSRQQVKIITADNSTATYQGRVHVGEEAAGSVGHQHARGLLLDKTCEINSKPELEIFTDAVECAHGSAIGELEEEPLFYLKSRGLSETQAYDLLLQAYVAEVAETFSACRSFIEIQFCLNERMREFTDILKNKRVS